MKRILSKLGIAIGVLFGTTIIAQQDRDKDSLEMLKSACEAGEDDGVKETTRIVVPTFRKPKEVNGVACEIRDDRRGIHHKKAEKELAMAQRGYKWLDWIIQR